MTESDKLDAGRQSNEVELSAEDLFAMSPGPQVTATPGPSAMASDKVGTLDESGSAETARPPASAPGLLTEPSVARPEDAPISQRAPRARRVSVAAVVLTVGAVAATAAAVAVIVPSDRQTEPVMIAAAHPPALVVEEPAPPEVEGPPVLFKNPFDDTEVFEFPPGTSREEARAAVADLLIMRAQERRAMFDARTGGKR